MNTAIEELTQNLENYTRRARRMGGVQFTNVVNRGRGFRLRNAPYYTLNENNAQHIENLANSRVAPRWRRTGNTMGYYSFTNTVPNVHPNSIKLSANASAVFARIHRNANSREAFVSAVNKEVAEGKLNARTSAKMVRKYNALYPVEPEYFGGLTINEIQAMNVPDFQEFIAGLDKNTLARIEKYI